ncbi:MAG: sugar transferase [Candidatus Cloacimonetes bacterium]|nr:sugar transferase [Candidatus Cloacimonadota bacterium]
MKRIGRNREYVYIYKLRTMHPYSEYLQEYIHDRYNLDDSGKFKNDFRITGWGKVFRKLWLDELPQLLNLFRGEVSLVGTRALSEHYFRLYPKEMQDMRCRVKPGLVPPYYADMPESFDDIIASERNYLLKRQKNRFTTDFRYFFRALYNIMFKNARSR